MNGTKIAGITANLQAGVNSFQFSLPKGIFAIRVTGNEYAYTAKILNQTGAQSNPGIAYASTEKPASSSPQKSKSSVLEITTMSYTTGDQLLYKAASGNYSTIVTDVPTGSKTTNFDFVACADADSNNYTTVTIGTQTWMAENLKVTKYRNGDLISTTSPANKDISAESTPKYQWAYNGNETNVAKYGRLYTWYAVSDTGNIAPVGWHVATDVEWTTLTTYLGGEAVAGGKLKETGTLNWTIPNSFATNETGFFALPGGYRNADGAFFSLSDFGTWWSATQGDTISALYRFMYYNNSTVSRSGDKMANGFSVRCVRDF
jgi:uncharacterized protein (TIGR02145 family)